MVVVGAGVVGGRVVVDAGATATRAGSTEAVGATVLATDSATPAAGTALNAGTVEATVDEELSAGLGAVELRPAAGWITATAPGRPLVSTRR